VGRVTCDSARRRAARPRPAPGLDGAARRVLASNSFAWSRPRCASPSASAGDLRHGVVPGDARAGVVLCPLAEVVNEPPPVHRLVASAFGPAAGCSIARRLCSGAPARAFAAARSPLHRRAAREPLPHLAVGGRAPHLGRHGREEPRTTARLVNAGQEHMTRGDLVTARRYYERARELAPWDTSTSNQPERAGGVGKPSRGGPRRGNEAVRLRPDFPSYVLPR